LNKGPSTLDEVPKGQSRGGGEPPSAMPLLRHHRIPLAFLATRAHYWLMVNLWSTRTLRAFSAELTYLWDRAPPSVFLYLMGGEDVLLSDREETGNTITL